MEVRRGHDRARSLQHGHDQRDRLHLGVGQHLPLQPLPVPLGQPPVPGLALDGDGRLRGPHGQDGRRLQGHPHGRAGAGRQVQPAEHDEFLTYFNWQQFTDEEWELCPPVVAVGGDGAMYDIGFQNLSRVMASGKPIKVLVVDTQVYSNTGGQACTSGFIGQVSDMAQYGKAIKGKQEPRKEIGLIGMAHRTTYVMQSTIAHPSHMIEGFIQGLKARRPALFNLYTSCQPEHGIGDDMSSARPSWRSSRGPTRCSATTPTRARRRRSASTSKATRRSTRTGRPTPSSTRRRRREGDGAAHDLRGLRHHRGALPQAVPHGAAGHLEREHGAAGRVPGHGRGRPRGQFPYVWIVDKKQQLTGCWWPSRSSRPARTGATSGPCSARWPARTSHPAPDVEARCARRWSARSPGLMQWLVGRRGLTRARRRRALRGCARLRQRAGRRPTATTWRPGSTPAMHRLRRVHEPQRADLRVQREKKAVIKDRRGGPYKDLVKAAERCTARVIHPGLPEDRTEKDIDKWIKRGEKFN